MGAGLIIRARLWSGVFGREGDSWIKFEVGVDASSAISIGSFLRERDVDVRDATGRVHSCKF
jgi:hypothetical protein